jgi:hypothetical protein
MFVPCFSHFSLLEMRRRRDVYGRFKELFRVVPCMLMKSHEQLLEDEVRCYPDPSSIDPTLLGFSMLGGDGMDLVRAAGREPHPGRAAGAPARTALGARRPA